MLAAQVWQEVRYQLTPKAGGQAILRRTQTLRWGENTGRLEKQGCAAAAGMLATSDRLFMPDSYPKTQPAMGEFFTAQY
jgi:hypothetical protein